MSKGSGRRPASVTEAEIAANYERIFGKPRGEEAMMEDIARIREWYRACPPGHEGPGTCELAGNCIQLSGREGDEV